MKRILWLVLAIIPFLLNTAAAEKITVDPNTPQAQAKVQNGDSDPRLARKISYDCKVKPIREVLADLSTKTGITLVAGSSTSDWPVRDAKVTMFMKDVPLVEIMNSIARVMRFAWSKSGKQPDFSYRLVDDKHAVKNLEDQLSGHGKEQIAKRKALIAQLEKVAALTESETAALKEKSPYLYIMGKSGLAAAFVKFKRQVPQFAAAMANGEDTTISYSNLSKPAQASLLEIVRCSSWMVSGDPSDTLAEEDLRELTESPDNWGIRFTINPEEDYTLRPDAMGMYGVLMIGYGGDLGGIPIADPDHPYIKLMSREMISMWDNEDKPTHYKMSKEENKQLDQMQRDAECLEPAVKHQKDPDLQAKIEMKQDEDNPNQADLSEVLAGLCSFSFITDSYKTNQFPDIYCPEKELPLQDCIQACLSFTPFSWEKHGSIIEIWDRNWLNSRKAEIPDELIEKWEKQVEETGTLDIDCIAEIAALTDEQISGNLYNDDFFSESGNLFDQLDRSGEYFKAYNQLNKSQRGKLFSPSGLKLSDLNSKQREAFLQVIGGMDMPEDFPDLSASGIDLRGTATSSWDGQRYIYTMRCSINGAIIPGEYIISSPIFTFRTRQEMEKYYQEIDNGKECSEEGSSDDVYSEEGDSDSVIEEPYDGPSENYSEDSADPMPDTSNDPAEDSGE